MQKIQYAGIWETQQCCNIGARFDFHTEPQPVFNKNFELLTDKLLSNNSAGYETFIISESESQIERLRDIFSEINPDAHFNSLLAQSAQRIYRS